MEFKDIEKTINYIVRTKFAAGTLKANTNTMMDSLAKIMSDLDKSSVLLNAFVMRARELTPSADDLKSWETIIYAALVQIAVAGKPAEAVTAYTSAFA
jgi:hypothetical protein